MPRPIHALAGLLLLLAVVAAGCGDGSADASSAAPTATPAADPKQEVDAIAQRISRDLKARPKIPAPQGGRRAR